MSNSSPHQHGISMAVTHLNAPYGAIVSPGDLIESLSQGELRAASPKAAAILSYLFVEVEPRLVMQCAMESGSSRPLANQLYSDTIKGGAPRSALWESSIKALL